ncbi:MAG: heme ABC transporter permease [Rhizobiaceae bacterium]|nr:heme ABC transporter permease [Rhizobiaceae bacterium]
MSDVTTSTGFLGKVWDLANPTRFLRFANRLIPVLAIITALLFAAGLYLGFSAPQDYLQGATVQIMFIHVPAMWVAMMTYSIMSISAIGSLVWRHPLADVAIRAAIPIGAAFTFLGLVTGSLWGKPMWGTWWVWDARLTSVLILFIIYAGLYALSRAIDEPTTAARSLAVITLVGFINIPIIKFSVDWWNTLHQPASISSLERIAKPALDVVFLYPLLTMALAYSFLFFTLHLMGMRNEIFRRRIRSMRMLSARAADKGA